MKRLLDIVVALFGLIIASPVILAFTLLVFLQDFRFPFYLPPRVGLNGRLFTMVKLRSMTVGADKSGVNSTSKNDSRITPIGHLIRRFKLDELTQLWNVLLGSMSLVGPRPQVSRDVELYTGAERRLLSVRPGITDFSSIVFSDESAILAHAEDADQMYNQLIRPWKSRLGLFYIDHMSLFLDLKLIVLTAITLVSRSAALKGVVGALTRLHAPHELIAIAKRDADLVPHAPPGSNGIPASRETR